MTDDQRRQLDDMTATSADIADLVTDFGAARVPFEDYGLTTRFEYDPANTDPYAEAEMRMGDADNPLAED